MSQPKILLPKDRYVPLVLFGCVHIGHKNADLEMAKRYVDWAAKMGAYCLLLSDNFENAKPTNHVMNGYQMLVRGEVMRGKFRNSFENPEAFVPNKPTQVKFTLPDIAHQFKKGHRMMIQIQSSWFPLVDRNQQQFMNIYQAKDSDFKKAAIRIYHDASVIQLPVIKY